LHIISLISELDPIMSHLRSDTIYTIQSPCCNMDYAFSVNEKQNKKHIQFGRF